MITDVPVVILVITFTRTKEYVSMNLTSKVQAKVELFKLEIVLREASNKDKIRDRPAIYTRIFLLLEAVEAVDQAQEQEVQAPTIMCYPTEIL